MIVFCDPVYAMVAVWAVFAVRDTASAAVGNLPNEAEVVYQQDFCKACPGF